MNIDLNGAIKFLLSERYRSEFKVIDGLSQHPLGLNFEDWLHGLNLLIGKPRPKPEQVRQIATGYIMDPDSKMEVEIAVFKHSGGYISGVDASYLANEMCDGDLLSDPISGDLFIPEE